MVENTKELVATYLAQRSVDFALMINGSWGSGKTYFVQNSLSDVLKRVRMAPVYVSLNGISSFEEVAAQIVFGTGCGATKTAAKSFFLPFALKYLPEKSVSALISILKKAEEAKSRGWMGCFKTKNDLSPLKHLVIIDDLERVDNPESNLVTIMGRIFDEFIFKGYHVIFVGDESHLNFEKYTNEKEKYIRRTVRFVPDVDSVIDEIILSYTGIDRRHAARCCQDLKFFVQIFTIDNIRTIKRILDDFVLVASKVRDEAIFNNINKILFYNLAPIIAEIASGRLKQLQKMNIAALQNIEMQRYAEQARRYYGAANDAGCANNAQEVSNRTFVEQFIDRYDGVLPVKWFYCEPVMRFVLEGCVEDDVLNEAVSKWLPREVDVYHKALNLIWDFDGAEDDQFLKNCPIVIEGLKNGKYVADEVVLACELLSIYVQRKWIEVDRESLFANAIKALKKRWSDIADDYINPLLLHNSRADFLRPILNAIQEEASRRDVVAINEDVNKFLGALSSGDRATAWTFFPNSQRWSIFNKIVKIGKGKDFVNLSNWALSLVSVNVRENGALIDQNSCVAIECLVQELDVAIQSCDARKQPIRKLRLEELKTQFLKILNRLNFKMNRAGQEMS